MKYRAKAKTYKPCAFASCAVLCNRIYQDDKWRIMACSTAHAKAARAELDKVPDEEVAKIWPNYEEYFRQRG